MKLCVRCNETKPIERFSKRSRSKDGHSSWCKTCFKTYDAIRGPIRYAKEAPTIRDRAMDYYKKNKEERLEYIINWMKNNPDRVAKTNKKVQEKYREHFKERVKAQQKARWALKTGKITLPDFCEACKKDKSSVKRLEMHHPDYAMPLKVYRVCSKCHHKITRGELSNDYPFSVLLSESPNPCPS